MANFLQANLCNSAWRLGRNGWGISKRANGASTDVETSQVIHRFSAVANAEGGFFLRFFRKFLNLLGIVKKTYFFANKMGFGGKLLFVNRAIERPCAGWGANAWGD